MLIHISFMSTNKDIVVYTLDSHSGAFAKWHEQYLAAA